VNSEIIFPSCQLKPFINYYWIVELNNPYIDISYSQRIVPNGMTELFFHFGDKLISSKENIKTTHPAISISGQTTSFFDVFQTGKTGFISILFKPHSVKLFFDLSPVEISNEIIDLNLIIKNEAKIILEKIEEIKDNSIRIQIIENFLIKQYKEKNTYNFNRLSNCFKSIHITKGNIKISDLAKITCLSDKQFYRVFLEYTGISPKEFIKIIRVQNALAQLQQNKQKDLFQMAISCGYYDQSHFIKDFKILTGFTPKEYLESQNIYPDYF